MNKPLLYLVVINVRKGQRPKKGRGELLRSGPWGMPGIDLEEERDWHGEW